MAPQTTNHELKTTNSKPLTVSRQVWLHNEGMFKALAGNELVYKSEFFDHLIFNGQSSNNVSWLPKNFLQGSDDILWKHKTMNLVEVCPRP